MNTTRGGEIELPSSQGIFWLASFPKSGNTWFRIFLSNLLNDQDEPVSINELTKTAIASSRGWLDEVIGFDSADLYQQEVDFLRPRVYEWTAEQIEGPSYHKIHDACWQLDSNEWLIPAKATVGAIYFVRNPLDVAISYANHSQCSIDKAITWMSEIDHCFCKNKHSSLKSQTEQRLLTWSGHVTSWVDNPFINTHVIRYEDMKHQAQQSFAGAVHFLGLSDYQDRIAQALCFSDFKAIQKQEAEKNFSERPANAECFFRKGIAGDWQDTLTTSQIDRIISDHNEVMLRFGYLSSAGSPQVM